MGLNIIQKILGGKEIGKLSDERLKQINESRKNSSSATTSYNKIDYSSVSNYDSRRYMYGNGSSTSKKLTLNEQIIFGNSSSIYQKTEPTNYLGTDDTTPVTHGPTDVIGESNSTIPSEPQVIIPESTTPNENYSEPNPIMPSSVSNQTTPITHPEVIESLVEESSPEDYSNTGAETVDDTWTIVTLPEEPIVVESPTEPSNNQVSNNEIPTNYLDGYADYHLTPDLGRIQYNGHDETYYNLDMSGVVDIMRNSGFNEIEYPYSVREDGVKTLGGYIMVAADLNIHPRGSIIDTSLGKAIVCDTGTFTYSNAEQIDIAVSW